jgi:hypothetical protein
LEFSNLETTGVGASIATHIMTKQTIVTKVPTKTSKYRALMVK